MIEIYEITDKEKRMLEEVLYCLNVVLEGRGTIKELKDYILNSRNKVDDVIDRLIKVDEIEEEA